MSTTRDYTRYDQNGNKIDEVRLRADLLIDIFPFKTPVGNFIAIANDGFAKIFQQLQEVKADVLKKKHKHTFISFVDGSYVLKPFKYKQSIIAIEVQLWTSSALDFQHFFRLSVLETIMQKHSGLNT